MSLSTWKSGVGERVQRRRGEAVGARDVEMIRMMADGMDNHQIAAATFVTEGAVHSRRWMVLKRLQLKNAAHLIAWAFRNKIIE